jgi:hypothetical protein
MVRIRSFISPACRKGADSYLTARFPTVKGKRPAVKNIFTGDKNHSPLQPLIL